MFAPRSKRRWTEATDYTNSIAAEENATSLEAIKKSGKSEIHVLNAEQRKVWADKMVAPTYKWAEGRVGKEAIDLLKKAGA